MYSKDKGMRDLTRLQSELFDVCVVGAGVYGATVAYHLAAAGLTIAVIDMGDFCSATSANSLKILHGGLRYLQHGNFVRMRETIRARREFMRFAPHLVAPLACTIPTFGYGLRSPLAMQFASILNNGISADRNSGLLPSVRLASGHIISKKALLQHFPALDAAQISGGLIWYDALACNSERLVLEYLFAARDMGAELGNYLRAERILSKEGRITGIRLADVIGEASFDLSARWVVNAAGPWFDELLIKSGIPCPPAAWAKAVNIVVDKSLESPLAVGIESKESYRDEDAVLKRNKRFYFFVPWRNGTLIGTTYHGWAGSKDQVQATRDDVAEIVDEVNAIYPNWGLKLSNVSFWHAGLLPMADEHPASSDSVQLAKHSRIIEHAKEGGPQGLLSLRSIKYTTAPVEAKKITRIILKHHNGSSQVQQRQTPPANEIPQALIGHLQTRYGSRAGQVARYISGHDEQSWWLSQEPALLRGEIAYFIHEEMALTLGDVVFRRTGLGSYQCPSRRLLADIATCMADELKWDEKRQQKEIELVSQKYAVLAQGTTAP